MCKLRSRVYWVRVQVWCLLIITLYAFFTCASAVTNSSECDVFGTCSQICTDTQNGSYECSCLEGLQLGQDNRTCTLIDPQWKLIYAEEVGIRCISNMSNGTELITNFTNGQGSQSQVDITYDARSNVVYWTDATSGFEAIYRIHMSNKSETKVETVANIGLRKVRGIAFDWITGNIYFTDSTAGHIGVCRNDKDECVVIVKTDTPCNLALHPNQGLMFWTNESGVIFRAGMDGSFLQEILPVTIVQCPNGLVVDQGNSRIFWFEAWSYRLESARLDGSDRRVISTQPFNPYGIDILGDRIFWKDDGTFRFVSATKYNGSNPVTHKRESSRISALAIMHISNQPIFRSNPCQRAQKCSHICTLSPIPTDIKCFCPVGMILGKDARTCVELKNVAKLVVAFKDTIQSMRFNAIGKKVVEPIPVPQIKSISDVVYNPINRTLIISDIETKTIYEYSVGRQQLNVLTSKDLDVVVGLDIDVVGENLYWIDSGKKTIEAMALRTGARTVIQRGVEHAFCLLIDPQTSLLFIAKKDENGEANIYKIFLNGGTMRGFQRLKEPISLAFDKISGKIFWVEKVSGNVEWISPDGSSISTLLSSQNVTSDVVRYEDQIFWVDIFSQELKYLPIFDEYEEPRSVELELPRLNEHSSPSNIPVKMTIVDRDKLYFGKLVSKHECSRENPRREQCSHMCLLTVEEFVGECRCPEGLTLGEDVLTCKKIIPKEKEMNVTSSTTADAPEVEETAGNDKPEASGESLTFFAIAVGSIFINIFLVGVIALVVNSFKRRGIVLEENHFQL